MANTQYYYGKNKDSGLAKWGTDKSLFKDDSITNIYDDGGWFGAGETFDGSGKVLVDGATPGFGVQANSVADSLGGFGGIIDGISGLAGMWMDYSKLKAQKASSRDAHNASAKMYNNQLTRARDVQHSISGPGKSRDNRTNVANSTV